MPAHTDTDACAPCLPASNQSRFFGDQMKLDTSAPELAIYVQRGRSLITRLASVTDSQLSSLDAVDFGTDANAPTAGATCFHSMNGMATRPVTTKPGKSQGSAGRGVGGRLLGRRYTWQCSRQSCNDQPPFQGHRCSRPYREISRCATVSSSESEWMILLCRQ